MIWSMRMTTRSIVFDSKARRVHIRTRQGSQRSEHTLPFEQVHDVMLKILEGYRRGTDSPLGQSMSFQLSLVTDTGEFPLSRLAEQSLQHCEANDRSIWQILECAPPDSRRARSYRHAIQHRDRLQRLACAVACAASVVKRGGRARATRLAPALNLRGSEGEGSYSMAGE